MKLEFSDQIFGKYSYRISWKSFQREPSRSMRTDGRTNTTKLIVAFRNFSNSLKTWVPASTGNTLPPLWRPTYECNVVNNTLQYTPRIMRSKRARIEGICGGTSAPAALRLYPMNTRLGEPQSLSGSFGGGGSLGLIEFRTMVPLSISPWPSRCS